MNSFLDLHSSADYRNTNRPYYTGTWEYLNVSTDTLIPFQFTSTASDVDIYAIDTDGNEFDLVQRFRDSSEITSWTHTGSGAQSSSGATLLTWVPDPGDYWTSNTFTCTAGEAIKINVNTADFEDDALVLVKFEKGGAMQSQFTMAVDGVLYYTIATTGADYTVVIENVTSTITMVSSNVPTARPSRIHNSGDYWWYDGSQLYLSMPGGYEIARLKVVGSTTYYSDWMEQSGFTDKMKFKLSSTVDYGGIKYVEGYEQWIYKDATVRRSPKAEIEITSEQRNGVRIDEKKVSAIRYVSKMKVTESEYEAFIHSLGGNIEITDATGKVYAVKGMELSDPTWYRGNGILEISFIDENNISVWTLNNTAL